MRRLTEEDGARFDILIPPRGPVLVNGRPLQVPAAKSVHETVLDLLQGYAESVQDTVSATVNDQGANSLVWLTVAPDGSSEMVTEQLFDRVNTSPKESHMSSADALAPTTPISSRPPVGRLDGRQEQDADFLLAASSGYINTVPHEPIPDDLWPEIEEIRSMTATGALQEALDLATSLRERLSAQGDAGDPHSLEARSLEAYVAHLKGDFRLALTLVLGVARVRCNQRDHRASQEIFRAVAAWQRIQDHKAVATHGNELLAMCRRLATWAPDSARLTQLEHHIEQRLQMTEDHRRTNFGLFSPSAGRPVHATPWA
ncbi:hypothetical protein DMH25_38035 [Streptomyces sp. WAC 01325]|uniref:hypothetical protein n=1 Tax=Streptomyces sp. WAC 01325 TaxID=2203202 RepID=UPI000F868A43|nr:hypothetical protein [Streptomyces sp. WAC 01325]RSM91381.1 hypothetical protein DMH25_38035 [Streptomyces sp. WAC 01325]